jgi:poly(hydroxyalkanoate) granule-associated protein
MATLNTQYKRVQENVLDSAHKIFLAGLGTVKTVGDESGGLFDRMVERGKDLEAQGKKELRSWRKELEKTTSKVEGRVDRLGERLDEQLTGALHRLGVPTRDEIQTLTRRVEELSGKVDRIVVAPAAPQQVFHVVANAGGEGWKVEAAGAAAPVAVFGTKDEALSAAREIARKAEPSQVVVHRLDGTVQTKFGYGEQVN